MREKEGEEQEEEEEEIEKRQRGSPGGRVAPAARISFLNHSKWK